MEMKHVEQKLSIKSKLFLTTLSNYIDISFYYFGSILRPDYIPGSSDVDIDIFTDNEYSTVSKLLNYIKYSRKNVKNVVWVLADGTTSYGYKINHVLDSENMFEYSIYNTRFKDKILAEHRGKIVLPIYITVCLQLLKILFYKFNLISGKTYSETKRYLLSRGIGQTTEDKFLVY